MLLMENPFLEGFYEDKQKIVKKWSMVSFFEYISQYLTEVFKAYRKIRTLSIEEDLNEIIRLTFLIIEDLDAILIGLGLDGFNLEEEYKEIIKLKNRKNKSEIITYIRKKMREVFKELKKEGYLEFIVVLDPKR